MALAAGLAEGGSDPETVADQVRAASSIQHTSIKPRAVFPEKVATLDLQQAAKLSKALREQEKPGVSFQTGGQKLFSASSLPFGPSFLGALQTNGAITPPDTDGAVGPNHVMIAVNDEVRIQDRSGTPLSSMTLAQFCSPLGNCGDLGDPYVLYDPYAGRWMLAMTSDQFLTSSAVVIGVSASSDPTGTWFLYKYRADASGKTFAYGTRMGFNKTWIVVTVGTLGLCGCYSGPSQILVLDKADFYAHGTGRLTLIQDNGKNFAPATTYDNTLATEYLLQSSGSSLLLSNITGAVGSEQLNATAPVLISGSITWANSVDNDIGPQLGSSAFITINPGGFRTFVYRNRTLWAAHNIFLPASSPNRSSIQWWQFKPDGTVLQNALIDDPNAVLFRGYPSIAVNQNDDAFIGYSLYSTNFYASAAYSLRLRNDSPNTLEPEVVLKPGEGPYFQSDGTSNRWGDYSTTVVDPANDVDMWTLQEYAAAGNFWSTWWGEARPFKMQLSGPSSVTCGSAFGFDVSIQDSKGQTSAYFGTLRFASSDSAATVPADVMQAGGVGTFSATLRTPGAQTLSAADTLSPRIAASLPVSVSARDSLRLVAPASVLGGAPFTVSLDALGCLQNVDNQYAGTVTFSSSDGAAGLPSPYTFTVGSGKDNGSHVFSNMLTLPTLGAQTITATDNLGNTTSVPVAVNDNATTVSVIPDQSLFRRGSIVLQATVTPQNGAITPAGSVAFYDDGTLLGSGQLSGGRAQISVSYLRIGMHSLTATYTSTNGLTGSTSAPVIHRHWLVP